MPRVAELLRASRPEPTIMPRWARLIARDLRDAAELGRDRADLHPDLAVDPAVPLAAIERRAGQASRHIVDPAEEGPHLIDRMSDDEALPELDLRLPVGLDPRGCVCSRGRGDGARRQRKQPSTGAVRISPARPIRPAPIGRDRLREQPQRRARGGRQ